MVKTYFIKTYGCQANIADSNNIAGILEALGFEELVVPKNKQKREIDEMTHVFSKAALVVINTCSVRQKSEDKVYGLGKMLKNVKKHPLIVLTGCMVGSAVGERKRSDLNKLKNKTPWVSLYITSDQIKFLPAELKSAKNINWHKFLPKIINPKHAYVNISNGCDNFCSYCVVPYARGAEVSRTEEELIKEVTDLLARGVAEITLCGQNVNSWGLSRSVKFKLRAGSDQKLPFVGLLKKLLTLGDLKKLDFISSNPFDFTNDLVRMLAHPKIGNYIHIAVQSGNNEILHKMNRRHTAEQFVKLIEKIRKVRSGVEIGTDIIVGFPGETGAQFMDTVELVKRLGFNVCFISMYSQREGTFAQKNYKDNVSREEKKWRCAHLTKVWKDTKKAGKIRPGLG